MGVEVATRRHLEPCPIREAEAEAVQRIGIVAEVLVLPVEVDGEGPTICMKADNETYLVRREHSNVAAPLLESHVGVSSELLLDGLDYVHTIKSLDQLRIEFFR